MSDLELEYDDQSLESFHQVQLDPSETWVEYLHDRELGHYFDNEEPQKNRAERNRGYDDHKGRPEVNPPYEKDEIMVLTPAWVEFCKRLFCLAAFSVNDLAMFSLIENQFDSVMAYNRVIANNHTFPDGFMSLCFAGNIGHVIGESKPNANFGPAWIIECLDFRYPPPDVEQVFWLKPWLWSKATICRYAFPQDNIEGLENPWQHSTYFPQLDAFNAHVPLPVISRKGIIQVQKVRCRVIRDYMVPNPYFPPRHRRTDRVLLPPGVAL